MRKIKKIWSDPFNRKLFLFFIIFSLTLISLLVYQQQKIKNQPQNILPPPPVNSEHNDLRNQLDDLIEEHDNLLDEYGNVNEEMEKQDSIIQQRIAEIQQLLRRNDLLESELRTAKDKISALQDIAQDYLFTIDSLLLENQSLVILKDSVIAQNQNVNWKNYKLNKENEKLSEKVSRGSVLEVIDLDVRKLRYKSTGREVSTRSAKKVQKLSICFTVGANQISDAETKTVYMQLIGPDGMVIEALEEEVIVGDSVLNITTMATFEYNNIEVEACFEWERVSQLEKGSYLIKLIIEGRISSEIEFTLRS